MSLTELNLNIPPEHIANVFGQFDAYIKKIEKTFQVTVVNRNESIKILGNSGILYEDELRDTRKVLTAAALTYVAGAASAILQLLRILLLANRKND